MGHNTLDQLPSENQGQNLTRDLGSFRNKEQYEVEIAQARKPNNRPNVRLTFQQP